MNATFSFEVFPPKSPKADAALKTTLKHLAPCGPAFWSVTDGAGGSAKAATLGTAERIAALTGDEVAAHLTAINRTPDDIADRLNDLRMAGVRRIVALRGDVPSDGEIEDNSLGSSVALINEINRTRAFEILAACYPEPHPDSAGLAADMAHLRRKQEAGASKLITQFCFETDKILRYRDQLARHGIDLPLIPGIMPIKRFSRIKQFSARCGATIPLWLERAFAGVDETSPVHAMVAAGIAADQCRRLIAEGMDHLHIYCLNDAALTEALARLLPIKQTAGTIAA